MGVAVAVVVWNNTCYREIRDWMTGADIDPVGVDVAPPDLDLFARSMGAGYVRAETVEAIGIALSDFPRQGGPVLIEYRSERDAKWT